MSSPFDWSTLVDVADSLLATAISEQDSMRRQAYMRSVPTRAYYGAFNFARTRWELENGGLGVHEIHDNLIRRLSGSAQSGHKQAARLLFELKRLRVRADYHAATDIDDREARIAIVRARNAMDFIRRATT